MICHEEEILKGRKEKTEHSGKGFGGYDMDWFNKIWEKKQDKHRHDSCRVIIGD